MRQLSNKDRLCIKERAKLLCTQIGLDVRSREKIIPILIREFDISSNQALRMFVQVKREKKRKV